MTAGPQRILLVEDSSLIADALRVLLEEHGYSVTVADSLAAARAAFGRDRADIVLLDVSLPDGDGLDFARELAPQATTRVLALTGHADDVTRARCVDAGCHQVLVKPVPSAELMQRLREIR